jgi:hypothetical protein
MKNKPATLLLLSILALASCTTAERQTLAANAEKDALAAGVGYLGGGKAGALAGLSVQELANLKAMRTAAKNPPAQSVNP